MTKVDIVSGFLGAGKTTLIRKLIEEAYKGEKVVLIENEFGEVGIDGGFLKDAGIQITEMNSGCICCTLVGDFGKNLKEVIETYSPDRILIEPSGVGKLSDVMKSVLDVEETHDIKLNGLITVVNGKKALKQMRAFGEFFNNQIEYATTVVLSRTQEMEPAALDACVSALQGLNAKASLITTDWSKISGEAMLKVIEREDSLEMKLMAEEAAKAAVAAHEAEHHHHDHDHDEHEHHNDHDHDEHEHHHDHDHDEHEHHHDHDHDEHHHDHDHDEHEHHHHHHHADDVFTSWGKETAHKYEKSTIESILKELSEGEKFGVILRAKGMVENVDGTWIYFDLVDGDYEIRTGEPDYTGRLCVIGCDIKEDDLLELFGLK